MTTKDEVRSTVEALKMALEVLEILWDDGYEGCPESMHKGAITAIREALAPQPAPVAEPHKQQEPAAVYVGETWCGSVVRLYEDLPLETPLYTSPQPRGEATLSQRSVKPWVGLTDEEIQKEFHPLHATGLQFARAIEAKLKEKNGF